MANIIPDGWRELALVANGAAEREIETLAVLADGLPDDYVVYHGVHWATLDDLGKGHAIFGEIDFAIVNRSGDLLIIEQKNGFLDETDEGLVKRYQGRPKRVAFQMGRTRDAMMTKLRSRPDCRDVHLESLLYCPDYRVKEPQTAGILPERIVDASSRSALAERIMDILPPGENQAQAVHVHRFLRDIVQLEPDVSALLGRAEALVTRISGGLAHWARQLEMQPFQLRVSGTAGSGKSQLALAEYQATLAAGKRPLYVCFNRPLADHFARITGTDNSTNENSGGLICTYHMLCDLMLQKQGITPDFTRPDAFEHLAEMAAKLAVPNALIFDTLIVDEGQDFSDAWRERIFRHASFDARIFWLEDPMQNLYGKKNANETSPLDRWVTLRTNANYRSPRAIVHFLNDLTAHYQHLLHPATEPEAIEALSPFEGDDVEILTYGDGETLRQRVKEAIRSCYSAGFRKNDVALVSYHGRSQSQLIPLERLGQNTLKAFTGDYDLLGQPIYSDGDLLVESVYRFKGQSAPAVIFAEIDSHPLDAKALHKLFVGCTRASMKLILIANDKTAKLLPKTALPE